MNFCEKKLGGITVYDGKILRLEVDEVELPDGAKAKRECVRHHGGAAVLCVIDGEALLVKQFRYLYGKEIYEIPAGKLERGENPQFAAARELEEETGYVAGKLTPYLTIYPTPGYTDEVINVYLAEDLKKRAQKLDDGEFLSVEFIKLEKAVEMIANGEICDGKTVAAIYKYLSEKK
ncbi:MAG: NUDIX hydrolase [Clostridia bacterium]|jgi:ADP-ribose pyrophosphatase|nr:NUDIX hydrolase [Clostridia bacterium]